MALSLQLVHGKVVHHPPADAPPLGFSQERLRFLGGVGGHDVHPGDDPGLGQLVGRLELTAVGGDGSEFSAWGAKCEAKVAGSPSAAASFAPNSEKVQDVGGRVCPYRAPPPPRG